MPLMYLPVEAKRRCRHGMSRLSERSVDTATRCPAKMPLVLYLTGACPAKFSTTRDYSSGGASGNSTGVREHFLNLEL